VVGQWVFLGAPWALGVGVFATASRAGGGLPSRPPPESRPPMFGRAPAQPFWDIKLLLQLPFQPHNTFSAPEEK
jgi:hypothetical protein